MGVVLNTDGGARGNPGPAGIGFALSRDGEIFCSGGTYIGETTNNIAEYKALLWGLQNAIEMHVEEIDVRADSELMVKQLNGEYKVKNEALKPLYAQAKDLFAHFSRATVSHVYREENKEADKLANEAMDARSDVGDFVCPLSMDSLF